MPSSRLIYSDLKIQFPNGLHVNSMDRELIDALVDIGMASANIAIESGCDYVLKNIMKKNVDLDKAKDLVKYIRNEIKSPCLVLLCSRDA